MQLFIFFAPLNQFQSAHLSLKWSITVSSNKKSTSCYKNRFPPGCCWRWRRTKNCGRICWDATCKLNAGTFLCYVRSTYTLPILNQHHLQQHKHKLQHQLDFCHFISLAGDFGPILFFTEETFCCHKMKS